MFGRETRMLLRHYLEQGASKSALARQLGVSRDTIHRWIRSGDLDRDLDEEPVRSGAGSFAACLSPRLLLSVFSLHRLVALGARPASIRAGWLKGHVADYLQTSQVTRASFESSHGNASREGRGSRLFHSMADHRRFWSRFRNPLHIYWSTH